MIKVRYFYSACVGIETPDLSILCDPWFTEGAYDGSWYHYPPFEQPLTKLPRYEYIYVSHIHPDHYDPRFLKQYLNLYPQTKIIISNFSPNFLSKKMQADRVPHEVMTEFGVGGTLVQLFPNKLAEVDIDSALAVAHEGESVVNMNDNLFDASQIKQIRDFVGRPTIALLGYTGAGPYPQTYYEDTSVLESKAIQKKYQFFERYKQMDAALGAKVNIPFAGKYILGGKLYKLNPYRGVADATEILQIDPKAVVLADGGDAFIDTQTLRANKARLNPYYFKDIESYARSLAEKKMDYEEWFEHLRVDAIPLRRLLPKAYQNAVRYSKCQHDYFFCIELPQNGEPWFVLNARKNSNQCFFANDVENLVPRSELSVDPRYLFGLISTVFHWNNAEVGSQYRTRRIPDEFNRQAQFFLSFFHV